MKHNKPPQNRQKNRKSKKKVSKKRKPFWLAPTLPQVNTNIQAYPTISLVTSNPPVINWPVVPHATSDPPTSQELLNAYEYVADVSQVATGSSRLHDALSFLGNVNNEFISNLAAPTATTIQNVLSTATPTHPNGLLPSLVATEVTNQIAALTNTINDLSNKISAQITAATAGLATTAQLTAQITAATAGLATTAQLSTVETKVTMMDRLTQIRALNTLARHSNTIHWMKDSTNNLPTLPTQALPSTKAKLFKLTKSELQRLATFYNLTPTGRFKVDLLNILMMFLQIKV